MSLHQSLEKLGRAGVGELAERAGMGERVVAGDWPGVGRRIERAAVGYLGDGGEEPESSIRSWLPFCPSQSRP